VSGVVYRTGAAAVLRGARGRAGKRAACWISMRGESTASSHPFQPDELSSSPFDASNAEEAAQGTRGAGTVGRGEDLGDGHPAGAGPARRSTGAPEPYGQRRLWQDQAHPVVGAEGGETSNARRKSTTGDTTRWPTWNTRRTLRSAWACARGAPFVPGDAAASNIPGACVRGLHLAQRDGFRSGRCSGAELSWS